jgi:hypothetical protein
MQRERTTRGVGAAALLVVALAAVVLPGSSWWSGPVLLTLTRTHGVHLTDLSVVAMALAVAVAACRQVALARRNQAGGGHGPATGLVALATTAAAGSSTRPSEVPYPAVATST